MDNIVSNTMVFKDRTDVDVMGKDYFETLQVQKISQVCKSHGWYYGLIRHEWQEGRLYSYVTASDRINSEDISGVPGN